MSAKTRCTLGSLFDGIGGFPYAGSFFGIEPLWASEILPQAVSVAKRHFPGMGHVGDIAALDGAKLPPVDIVTFGSPCQDLSVAGKRAGLGAERSGLFMEAVRVIDEMREATHGCYPRYAVWENVTGALSSGGPRGSDFRAVLKAFAKAEVPMPRSGRWANAGMVRGGGADIAWCVYSAQHFGVPQRRRRVFLVASFGAGCPAEVLFVPKSLPGHFAARRAAGEAVAAVPPGGAGGAGGDMAPATQRCLTPWDTQQRRVYTGGGTAPTLSGADGGGGRNPAGLVYCAACWPEAARALMARGDGSPDIGGGPNIVAVGVHQNQAGDVQTSGAAYSLAANGNASGRNAPLVAHPAMPVPINDKATRYKGGGPTRNGDGAGNGMGIGEPGGPAPTLTGGDRHAVGFFDNARYVVRRFLPVECERLQGFPDGWTASGHNGAPISDTKRYTMLGNTVAVPCVAYVLMGIAEQLQTC